MANAQPSLILLPVDGSPSSIRAAQHCAKLAKAFGARVLLLNVQPAVEDWQTHGVGRQAALDHHAARSREAMAEPAGVLTQAGIAFESLAESGSAPEVIARVAEERGCEAIVMGTRGQSELKSLVMGGVGMKVIHLAHVPVTLVR
jgi:nucleotide-binding universal stress UspA family protein